MVLFDFERWSLLVSVNCGDSTPIIKFTFTQFSRNESGAPESGPRRATRTGGPIKQTDVLQSVPRHFSFKARRARRGRASVSGSSLGHRRPGAPKALKLQSELKFRAEQDNLADYGTLSGGQKPGA